MGDGSTIPLDAVGASIEQTSVLGDFETTSPTQHNPNNFRYVVHTFADDYTKATQTLMGLTNQKAGLRAEVQHDPVENTGGFIGRSFISSSVIDQDHMGTWSSAGAILNVERENVVFTSPTDAGILASTDMESTQMSAPVQSFTSLLGETHPEVYNEIVVRGSDDYPPISISGVFVKADHEGNPLDLELAQKARILAQRLNVPTIIFKMPKQEDFDLTVKPAQNKYIGRTVRISRDGNILEYNPDRSDGGVQFFIYSNKRERPMSANERSRLIKEMELAISKDPANQELLEILAKARIDSESEVQKKYEYTPPVQVIQDLPSGSFLRRIKPSLE